MTELIALVIATAAAIHHFGWIDGAGLGAALIALMPYKPTSCHTHLPPMA